VEARNGEIAVSEFKKSLASECGCPNRGFKLVLMDIQMPVMCGIEAAEQILKMGYQTNIVALTSYTGKEVKKKCMDVGMKAVYNKPVSAESLRKIIL
jgi:CheY-like chemotaxis protein